jgi:16S rRNA (uracil1498-N3)-methyltransferase
MPKFFVPKGNIDAEGRAAFVEGDDARHIARSLRMAVGDGLTLSDGEGASYAAVLTKIRDERCELEITEVLVSGSEPRIPVTLFMAYPKSDKLETIIQKATELGATAIIPFESSRCIKRPSKDKADAKRERLTRIAKEAAKQCGRDKIPFVSDCISFKECLKMASEAELALFCYEDESGRSVKDALGARRPSSVSVVVGSEGGFSTEEAELAKEAGLISESLGARILRCETAPDYVLAAISYEYEL